MKIFVDTSALYSLMDRSDNNHLIAGALWERVLMDGHELITTNYIMVETFALVQNRLGISAAQDLQGDIAPLLDVEWVGRELHQTGIAAVLTANRRQLSLVDCISFVICRQRGIDRIFAFDPHYWEQGFLPV